MSKKGKYDEKEILRRHNQGQTRREIAEAMGITSASTVGKVLNKNNIYVGQGSRNLFTDAEKSKILQRYIDGEGMKKIGLDYGVSYKAIKTLITNRLDASQIRKRQTAFTEEQGQMLREEYEKGKGRVTHKMLSEKYGGSISSVRSAIIRAGGVGRGSGALPVMTPQKEREAAMRYFETGKSAEEIGIEFGVSESTILNAIRNSGYEPKPLAGRQKLDDSQLEQAKRIYDNGNSLEEVGDRFGVSASGLRKLFIKAGYETRARGTAGDSIQEALDRTGRHSIDEESELYIYTINGHPEQLKIGIKAVRTRRAIHSHGYYGEKVWWIRYATRRHVLFLEQAILKDTFKFYDPPDELIDFRDSRGEGWIGITELRKLQLHELEPYLKYFISELDDKGIYSFAELHVPMTDAQRARCRELAANEPGA